MEAKIFRTNNPYKDAIPDDVAEIWEEGCKAGIKEVVEWVATNTTVNIPGTEDYCKTWQAKLKEWGVESR